MMLRERWRTLDPAWKFAFIVFVIVRVFYSAWALVIVQIFPVLVQNLTLFGEPIVAVYDQRTAERATFSRMVDGRELHFRAAALNGALALTDVETGRVWSIGADSRLARGVFPPEEIFPFKGVTPETSIWLAPWERFDAFWYLAIAERGYGTVVGDVHFPPLYPVLIRVVGVLIGNSFVAALLISNLALIAALAVFYQTARDWFDAPTASRATVYLMLFPTAGFFFSAYTESLFLLAAILALRLMQKRVWLWAGFLTFCAILLRLQGIALVVPLAYELWCARPRDKILARVVGLALPCIALALYLFLRAAVGEPTVVPTSEPNLFARLAPSWENYLCAIQTLASGKFITADVLNFIVTTCFIVALAVGWRKLPLAFGLYAAASLIVLTMRVVETQPLNSMSRYALTLFPIFILLGVWGKNAWAQRAIVYPSVALGLYLSAQFFMWGWVG